MRSEEAPIHIVLAGSSGFLGRHLVQELTRRGHRVTRLVRRSAGPGETFWDPYAGPLDAAVVDDADVVINLAGSPTAGNPHSKKWARELRSSRVTTTRRLAEAIASTGGRAAFLAGNGISYYGDHGADVVTEDSGSRGDALLTQVTREWQAATTAAEEAGARVCVLRTSPVMDAASPPLKLLLPVFRFGLGARLGDGRQYFPSISLRDWVGAVSYLATHVTASGPVNLCSPVTPTNAEFTEALAEALGRKARLAAPKAVLKRGAGALAPEVLGSINAHPQTLLDAGYRFADEDIRAVLAAAMN